MTFSEFGRRPEDNDTSGTDHGTAAPLFVIGDQRQRRALRRATVADQPRPQRQPASTTVDFRQLYATILDQWLKADSREVLGYNFGNLGLFKQAGPSTGGGSGSPGVPTRPVRRLRKRLTSA